MNWTDSISALLRQLTEFFGATHPIRVGTAVCLGIALHGGLTILASTFPDIMLIKGASALNPLYYVVTMLGLAFLPVAFGGRGAPESAVNTIRIIRALMDAANYSQQRRILIWHALITKYIDAARPEFGKTPSTQELFKEAEQQTSDQVSE